MMLLTGISGSAQGASWPLDGARLTLGRAADCDVVIGDFSVSRHHCELALVDGVVQMRDLDSRNATLVNGIPQGRAILGVGDTLAVGPATFVVTSTGQGRRVSSSAYPQDKTVRLSESEVLYLNDGHDELAYRGRPETVQDMAVLFRVGRQLSCANSISELVNLLSQFVTERLAPSDLWIALCEEGENIVFPAQMGGPGQKDVTPYVHDAIKDMRALRTRVLPQDESDAGDYYLVAPMLVSGQGIGALAVRVAAEDGETLEGRLEYLLALAHQSAPFFLSVEQAQRQRRELERLRAQVGEVNVLLGKSRSIGRVRALLRSAGRSDLNVLVHGETGTGKELAAKMIHDLSERVSGPYVPVNCAAIPADLFESEIFGHEKGAFTDAGAKKLGRVEQAHSGTLFLDEVGDLTLDNQARILRVIEEGVFHRVGGEKEIRVDIRVVSATNKNLEAVIAAGAFREDLYHRLNGFEIYLPPLRDRPSDIPILAEHFLDLGRHFAGRNVEGFSDEALEYLTERSWSGNVRELRNTVYRAVAMAKGMTISLKDIRLPGGNSIAKVDSPLQTLAVVEKEHISDVLRDLGGNISATARALAISRNTLYKKIADYDIEV